jgi:hypothetical protein
MQCTIILGGIRETSIAESVQLRPGCHLDMSREMTFVTALPNTFTVSLVMSHSRKVDGCHRTAIPLDVPSRQMLG